MTKDSPNSQASTHVTNSLFKSIPLEQKIVAAKAQLRKDKERFDERPYEEVVKERFIKQNVTCADLYIENKDYESAKEYLSIADQLTAYGYYLKTYISTRLQFIEDETFLKDNLNKQPPDAPTACCRVM